jgi:hypothetical protein
MSLQPLDSQPSVITLNLNVKIHTWQSRQVGAPAQEPRVVGKSVTSGIDVLELLADVLKQAMEQVPR